MEGEVIHRRGEGHAATEKQTAVLQPQAQKDPKPPEADGRKEHILPSGFGRVRGPADTLMLTQ